MDFQNENISDHNFEQCTKCTICTAYCPVTPINPAYPGPKQAGPDGERYRLKDPDFFEATYKYCLNCKRCEVACPSDVRIGDIILAARLKHTRQRPSLRDTMLAETDIMGTVATTVAPVVNATLSLRPVKYIMDKTLGIDGHRQFPRYAGQKFTSWFNNGAIKDQQAYRRYVSYFHGCYVNYNYPALGKAFVNLLNAAGIGIRLLDRERCCGVAKISNRLIKEATRDAQINLSAMQTAVNNGSEAILTTSSTCCFTIRDEYPHILGLDNSSVRGKVIPATAYLHRLIEAGDIRLIFRNDYRRHIAYHTPCHMDRLGMSHYSIDLLRMIPGVQLTVLDSNCCGIAGTYGFKKENYETSQAIGSKLFNQIEAVMPDFVATDCETCKWQIEMSTSRKVLNPIEVLAEALDIDATRKANAQNTSRQ